MRKIPSFILSLISFSSTFALFDLNLSQAINVLTLPPMGVLTTKPYNYLNQSLELPLLSSYNFGEFSQEKGAKIRRTMKLLATSNRQKNNQVKILFYGQSITKQAWWLDVAEDLRKRFPYADLQIENRAIGGFASPLLMKTAEHDIYPYYPDLIIFHVYGGEPEYEAIIANIRTRTTAEIAIQSDHINWLPTGKETDDKNLLAAYEWHENHSTKWLPEIAEKYGCEMIEIRQGWRRYLKENKLEPQDLLMDGIHLNDRGNALLASLVKPHLYYNAELPLDDDRNLVKTYEVGKDIKWRKGKLILEFEGNKIDLISQPVRENSGKIGKILIDGKPPSKFPELYGITRASDAYGVDQPAILQINSEKPLIVEDWQLIITDINEDATLFKFKLFGSKTGFDGTGDNQTKFISQSGRVVIQPENWWVKSAQEYTKKTPPKGFIIRWQVKPLFTDIYTAPEMTDLSREYVTILAQNLTNTKHRLEILPQDGKILQIKALRVYQPPLKNIAK
jgi:hypothetical protein